MSYRLFFIIGAPRSGTNMLRDVLTSLSGVETWPCDEINYILRHGNLRFPSDELSANEARPEIKRYLRKTFEKYAGKFNAEVLVEKTCANSLRVAFLNEVFPDAQFIFIVRDGLDATGSAKLRWTARLDPGYILDKARYVPLSDLPYYGARYLWSRIYRLFSKEKRLASWGPKLANMQELLAKHSLNEVCAIQWRECVDKSERDLAELPESRVCKVKYEDFVQQPQAELARILDFMDVQATQQQIESAVDGVSGKSIGKGRSMLGQEEVERLEPLIGETLRRHGYLPDA
jgi:hypothetical protein